MFKASSFKTAQYLGSSRVVCIFIHICLHQKLKLGDVGAHGQREGDRRVNVSTLAEEDKCTQVHVGAESRGKTV